jgi:Ca-activated chloride channel family protein
VRFANINLLPYIIILFILFVAILVSKNINFGKISFSNYISLKGSKLTVRNLLIYLPDTLKIIGVILLCVALLRPQSVTKETKDKIKGIDIIIALDLSGSMQAEDLEPNRLEAAKDVCRKFVNGLTNDRVGMVVFAGKSFTQCPLTVDYEILKTMLDDVDLQTVRIDGTAIGEAIINAVNRLENSGTSKVVILTTDGQSNRGVNPIEAAKIAAYKDIKIYTIGLGKKGGVEMNYIDRMGKKRQAVDRYGRPRMWEEPDEKTLKTIAELTGAYYFRATNKQSLREIYNTIGKLEKKDIKVKTYDKYHEKFYIFLIIGMIFIFLAFILEVFWFTRIIT